jgi:glycosyltransferase involved in cell wall biosynthesis
MCLLKALRRHSRCRLVSMDTVLPIPLTDTIAQRLALRLKQYLFGQVERFIEYFKAVDGYVRHYAIPRERFRYVPFKVNRYEQVLRTPTCDEGWIFCGGRTRRDFKTLFDAVRDLPLRVKVVTMDARAHGSQLDLSAAPPNVDVVWHDGSDTFLEYIAKARFAVIPIVRENISASGIGVYLACMALGKAVVISNGPAVEGVLPAGAAVVVPPGDVAALRTAIATVHRDDALREAVANAGKRYALALGSDEQLCRSVADVLVEDLRLVTTAAGDGRSASRANS